MATTVKRKATAVAKPAAKKARSVPAKRAEVSPAPGVTPLKRSTPPPKRGRGNGSKWDAIIEQVRQEPGVWFELATWAGKGSASTTSASLKKKFPDVTFTSRTGENGSTLWAAFKPE